MPITKQAVKILPSGVAADLEAVRIVLPASGRREVQRSAGVGEALFRRTADLIGDLAAGHAKTKVLFARIEDCYRTVLANPRQAILEQARIEITRLHELWDRQLRRELEGILTARAQKDMAPQEVSTAVSAAIAKLDEFFNARFGFVTYTTQFDFSSATAFAESVRRHAAASVPPFDKETLDTLSDITKFLPFFKSTSPGAVPGTDAGDQLLKALRSLTKPPEALIAIKALEQLCGEGHFLYHDVTRIVDDYVRLQKGAGIDIEHLVNAVQGRTAEAAVLAHPEFVTRVWKPAQRTAEELRQLLNADLPKGIAAAHQWRVLSITEPLMATTSTGTAGQLLDSGIWLIRDAAPGETAQHYLMPVFALEVKSGELRGSVTQLALGDARMQGGFVHFRGEPHLLVHPPIAPVQKALATTRTVTDYRILREGLPAGAEVVTVKVPLSRDQTRAAARAMAVARLQQLGIPIK